MKRGLGIFTKKDREDSLSFFVLKRRVLILGFKKSFHKLVHTALIAGLC